MAELKHKLAELRQEKQYKLGRSITLTEIAKAAGVSRQTMSNWLNSGSMDAMKSKTIVGLLRYFGKRKISDLVYIDWTDEDSE